MHRIFRRLDIASGILLNTMVNGTWKEQGGGGTNAREKEKEAEKERRMQRGALIKEEGK